MKHLLFEHIQSIKLFFACFLSVLSLVFTGCEDYASEVAAPKINPKLVVGCFISPQDTLVTVAVSRSTPIFGQHADTSTIQEALVVLSDKSHIAVLTYHPGLKRYAITASLFPIQGGQTYYLTVKTPEEGEVSAYCTVPLQRVDKVDSKSATDTIIDSNGNKRIVHQYVFTWIDFPGQEDHYRAYFSLNHPNSFPMSRFVDDLNNDGDTIGVGFYPNTTAPANFYLIYMDEQYRKYYKSLDNYSGSDPFSEPSPIYSNIQGGLGIFCAYQQVHLKN